MVSLTALERKMVRDVWRWRGQVTAIAVIVACGIAAFVTLLTVYRSLNESLQRYYTTYRFADVFATLTRAPDSASGTLEHVPGVAVAQTRIAADVIVDVPTMAEPASGMLLSIPEYRTPMLNDLFIRQGRYIRAGASDEVIANEAFATANALRPGDTIGAVMNGRWQQLHIVGIALSPEFIYQTRPGDLWPDDKHFGVIWMGHDALAAAMNMTDAFNDVSVRLGPGANAAAVIASIDRVLAPYGGTGAYARADQFSNYLTTAKLQQLRVMAVIFPVIFLSVAAFLLHVLLGRLVATQRDQIAVLKAFGYANGPIALHYLGIVAIVVFSGACGGIAVGSWWGSLLTSYYERYFHFPLAPFHPAIDIAAAAFAASALAALAGALTAVRAAASLPPAEAMRPEPPATYRPTKLERTRFLAALSPVGRMMLRNLERKPAATAVSVFAIGFAVSLVMMARLDADSVYRVIDVQYNFADRGATLSFNQPVSGAAANELAGWPGVMHVEPFRVLAARIVVGNRSRRVSIVGLPRGGQLHELVDASYSVTGIPPAGVVLSKKLAQVLGATRGAVITAQVLEGARPTLSLPVVGVVNDLIGMSVYTDLGSLDRIAGLGTTISGAYLHVDRNQEAALYAKVKRTPAIAGLVFREAELASFMSTLAEGLLISTAFIMVFACAMAFGVMYNSGRIALSERARELSTMRILGFSKSEIWNVLFGEQVWLTLAALPFGFALGAVYGLALARVYDLEFFRFPIVISTFSLGFAFAIITVTLLVSGWLLRRRTDALDLVAVLKAGD